MTQIMDAKKGILTDEMKQVAAKENVSEEFILKSVANGTIVIPSNVNRDIEASGIGAGLRTKVNATVGTSTDIVDFDEEVLEELTPETQLLSRVTKLKGNVIKLASFNQDELVELLSQYKDKGQTVYYGFAQRECLAYIVQK